MIQNPHETDFTPQTKKARVRNECHIYPLIPHHISHFTLKKKSVKSLKKKKCQLCKNTEISQLLTTRQSLVLQCHFLCRYWYIILVLDLLT